MCGIIYKKCVLQLTPHYFTLSELEPVVGWPSGAAGVFLVGCSKMWAGPLRNIYKKIDYSKYVYPSIGPDEWPTSFKNYN